MISSIELFGTTDVGQVRDHNEDNFLICKDLQQKEWNFKRDEKIKLSDYGSLLVVADGMGGSNAGEVASDIAQATVKEAFERLKEIPASDQEKENLLKKIIRQSHDKIVEHQQTHLETAGMGTTMVVAWVIGAKIHVAWCGDSRCYIYNGQETLLPFTDDHSLVWGLVKDGIISVEDAREHPESHIITQSLGDQNNPPKPSSKSSLLYKGNKVILCSDGLNGMLTDEQIRYYVQQEHSVAEICKELTQAANKAGGTDNITVLLLEVLEGELPKNKEFVGNGQKEAGSKRQTNTQILRSKNTLKNYLLAIASLVVGVLIMYILLLPDQLPKEKVSIHKTLADKSFQFASGETQLLDLKTLFSEKVSIRDNYKIEGLGSNYEDLGNGRVNFTFHNEEVYHVRVRISDSTEDTVFIYQANLIYRPKSDLKKHDKSPKIEEKKQEDKKKIEVTEKVNGLPEVDLVEEDDDSTNVPDTKNEKVNKNKLNRIGKAKADENQKSVKEAEVKDDVNQEKFAIDKVEKEDSLKKINQ